MNITTGDFHRNNLELLTNDIILPASLGGFKDTVYAHKNMFTELDERYQEINTFQPKVEETRIAIYRNSINHVNFRTLFGCFDMSLSKCAFTSQRQIIDAFNTQKVREFIAVSPRGQSPKGLFFCFAHTEKGKMRYMVSDLFRAANGRGFGNHLFYLEKSQVSWLAGHMIAVPV